MLITSPSENNIAISRLILLTISKHSPSIRDSECYTNIHNQEQKKNRFFRSHKILISRSQETNKRINMCKVPKGIVPKENTATMLAQKTAVQFPRSTATSEK